MTNFFIFTNFSFGNLFEVCSRATECSSVEAKSNCIPKEQNGLSTNNSAFYIYSSFYTINAKKRLELHKRDISSKHSKIHLTTSLNSTYGYVLFKIRYFTHTIYKPVKGIVQKISKYTRWKVLFARELHNHICNTNNGCSGHE